MKKITETMRKYARSLTKWWCRTTVGNVCSEKESVYDAGQVMALLQQLVSEIAKMRERIEKLEATGPDAAGTNVAGKEPDGLVPVDGIDHTQLYAQLSDEVEGRELMPALSRFSAKTMEGVTPKRFGRYMTHLGVCVAAATAATASSSAGGNEKCPAKKMPRAVCPATGRLRGVAGHFFILRKTLRLCVSASLREKKCRGGSSACRGRPRASHITVNHTVRC